MKKYLSVIFVFLFAVTLSSAKVKSGIEVLSASGFKQLQGKRVGLITNATGVNSSLVSTIDLLFKAPGVKLVALFGPEHGVRGDHSAGDKVDTYTDNKTGLIVYSLYGKNNKPGADQLKDIDVLVYDIQDIGCRSYTYISTMGLAMEAAAEFGKEFLVLDRPNPLGGERFEGAPVDSGFFSFVSQFAIPYVYGLTCGELAMYLKNENLIKNADKLKLSVIKMKGWKRKMTFADTGLPWVLTSPHIPYKESAFYYVTSGVMGELGFISEGVGYTLPFKLFGAPWITNQFALSDSLNNLKLPGISFRPLTWKPYYGKNKDKTVNGVELYINDFRKAELMPVQFYVMQEVSKLYPEYKAFSDSTSGRFSMFDKVNGTDKIRKTFSVNYRVKDILPILNKGVKEFREKAARYFLYN